MQPSENERPGGSSSGGIPTPSITLPKGGGAIRSIGEKFGANPVNGTGSFSIPLPATPGRSGFGPKLALAYDSAGGNSPYGYGWRLGNAAITRRTDRGLPRYRDGELSDEFTLGGGDDLVPVRRDDGTVWFEDRDGHRIHRYRPRVEGGFTRIERWTSLADGQAHWRIVAPDNATVVYGLTDESRIRDPQDASRVFTWLVSETYDDKGNAAAYVYSSETSDGVDLGAAHEANRTDASRSANRYLKRIQYGNRVSRLVEPDLTKATWCFELVFDYDEDHYRAVSGERAEVSIDPGAKWSVRPDPFSVQRSGFEVRTYRRCHRVLMFHRFDELGPEPCLVRSLELDYDDLETETPSVREELEHPGSTRYLSRVRSVTQAGYIKTAAAPIVRGAATYLTYERKSLPPVAFTYSQAIVEEAVQDVPHDSTTNAPIGLDASYRWVDLLGDGIAGLLTEQAGAWFFKSNSTPIDAGVGGDGPRVKLDPVRIIRSAPAPRGALESRLLFDVDGDGRLDAVELEGPTPGFYGRSTNGDWLPQRTFKSLPNVSLSDPNVKLIDLTGDGFADVLVTEGEVITWYEALGADGFARAQRVAQSLDAERGPRVLFSDGAQSIYLADMSGDGLTDIVRIRNGEACYWPNLGYGRFGARVAMDNAPWFDAPDQFDRRRLRLADIDGSGVIDLIYLGRDGVRLYFNQSGNRWSDPRSIPSAAFADATTSVEVVDLLGNGTACLVWSSPLPADAGRPMRYLRLMREKPHLLKRVINNLGAQTDISYAPSTKFYLLDRLAGTPWITQLPFPVHVVEAVETRDLVTRNRFTTRYAYHHGYFDPVEREFRGFAMVEQWDTEAYEDYVLGVEHIEGGQELAPELYQPPVLRRSWFHTGAYFDRTRISQQLATEYYGGRALLPDTVLRDDLDADELRECVRALKGMPLRSEIYSLDGSDKEKYPHSVTEATYEVLVAQRRLGGKRSVLQTTSRESVALYYDRDPSDPRISHGFNLELGPFGNVLKSASVVYGRKTTDATLPAEVVEDQQRTYITYVEVDYTDDIDRLVPTAVYRLRVPSEARSYEITGIKPAADLFERSELGGLIALASPIDYEVVADGTTKQKRLTSRHCTKYLDETMAPLPLGTASALGLSHESYRLAFTPGTISTHYGTAISDAELTEAGYVHLDGDASWWIPSGTAIHQTDPPAHFYIARGTRDPFGLETIAKLDTYDLLIEEVQVVQSPWNRSTAVNDYRVLGAVEMTDPNGNRSTVQIDALGLVVASAVMGKSGSTDGDTLSDPTERIDYDAFNWMNSGKPNYAHILTREEHGDPATRWKESYAYSSGTGEITLVKLRAEPGKALRPNADGTTTEVDADPRWLGNGRRVLNNKGAAVKQYEPYYSTTSDYESEDAVRAIGSTPIAYFDALGRNTLTVNPDGTRSRVEYHSWWHVAYDANDVVRESSWYSDRGSPDPAAEPEPTDPERRAAWLAAKHALTPSIVHFDVLTRPVYSVGDFGNGTTIKARTRSDLGGRFTSTYDSRERQVATVFCGMTSEIWSTSAERGKRWVFHDIAGTQVRAWDEHGRASRVGFDPIRRPIASYIKDGAQPEVLVQYTVFGDRHPTAKDLNLLGTAHLLFDQAGEIRISALDFQGNPKSAERILAKTFDDVIDWKDVAAAATFAAIQPAADPKLETGEVFATGATYDARNRPKQVTFPDGTLVKPTYDRSGCLQRLAVQVEGSGAFVDYLKEQSHDSKGRRIYARYGNDVITRAFYDATSFRLTRLLSHPVAANPETDALQDLRPTYDPVGNLTELVDRAQQTYYFANAVIPARSRYEYDAGYQLIRATGREHAGVVNDSIRTRADIAAVPQLPHVNDASAVRAYTEEYAYDDLGNITTMRHRWNGTGWTRHYRYQYEADAADRTNRLASTSAAGDPDAGPYSDTYSYDVYGNMRTMPGIASLEWGHGDQLRKIDLGGGGTAYYVYGTGGQRIRKVIDRNGSTRLEWIFLGAVTIFRRRNRATGEIRFERRSVTISDTAGLIAQIDTKKVDLDNEDPVNAIGDPVVRYQHGNHLGMATVETDSAGTPISFEDYHPYGTSSYRSAKSGVDLSLKRYRYSRKERDDESGLHYFGARYYASWLGRWTSSDPAGFVSGFNLYKYCSNNPVMFRDATGMDDHPLIVPHTGFTGEESWQDLQRVIPPGYHLDPAVNEQNFRSFWDPTSAQWNILAVGPAADPQPPPAPNPVPAAISITQDAATPVAGSVTQEARLRIGQPRTFTPGEPLNGPYNLWSNEGGGGLNDAARAPGYIMEDTIFEDLAEQRAIAKGYTGRYDSRLTYGSADFNDVWHPTSDALAYRAGLSQQTVTSNGLEPWRSPAGNPNGVQAVREIPRIQLAGGLMAQLGKVSGVLTFVQASQIDNPWVRGIGQGAGTLEFFAGNSYLIGVSSLGSGYFSAATTSGLMTFGRIGGRIGGGVGMVVLSGYSFYQDYNQGEYGVLLGDGAGVVAGGCVLAGAAWPVTAIAGGVGLTNYLGNTVEHAVTPHAGRTVGVAAGTAAGAATGAAIGAAIGVWGFGVAALPAAAVGGVIGGIAGFIGSYW